MAKKKKMTDDEIEQYIKSKSMSSEEYVAPKATVKKANVTKSNNVSKVNSNTSNLVSQPTVTSTQTVTMPTVNTVDSARKNYNEKLALFNNANQKIEADKVNQLNEQKKNSGLLKGGSNNPLEGLWNSYWDLTFSGAKGALNTLEGVADAAQYLTADYDKFIADQLNNKLSQLTMGNVKSNIASDYLNQYADALKENAKYNSTGSLLGENQNEQDNILRSEIRKDVKEKSYMGDLSNSVYEGLGNIATMAALSAVGGAGLGAAGVGTTATGGLTTGGKLLVSGGNSFTTAYGNSRSEAYNNGASDEDSIKYGIINGLAEAASEQIFDAMPGIKSAGVADKIGIKDFLAKKIQNGIGTNTSKIFLKLAGGLEEGSEEMISNALTTIGTDLMHMIDNSYTYGMENNSGNPLEDGWNALFSEDSLKSFISAGLTSAILGFGGDVLTSAQKSQLIKAYAKDNNISTEEATKQINQMIEQQQTEQPATQTETPQIETNPQDNINTQLALEQQEISPKSGNNENYGGNRIDDHTLEYNGYYIKTAKPNVGYDYKPLENSNQFQIYDANNDDITHQVAGNIMNIDDAKSWVDTMNEPNNRTTQNQQVEQKENTQNNNILETKSEDVLRVEPSKNITNTLNETIKGNNTDSQDFETMRNNIEKETGKKMRSWIETSTKATGQTELVNSMNKQKITYEPTSNQKNINSAKAELAGLSYEQKVEKAKAIINSDKRLKSTDIALLEEVTKEALESGNMNDFIDLVQDTAILGTESGQVVQALSLIRQSDPLTQIDTLRKLIEKEQAKGNKVYQGVEIKEDLVNKVLNSYNEDGTWNQENFDNAMDELKQDIADQMNVRPTEKLNAWRYLSMLGNPKTHIRNVVANIAMGGLQKTKNKIAAGIEAITPMNKLNKLLGGSEQATKGKTLARSTQEVKSYANETVDKYFKEHQQKSKYNETMGNLKGELESRRDIFSDKNPVGKLMNKLEKANSKALDIEDVVFNKATVKQAFANFLTANGIETEQDIENNPEIVAQGMEYAIFKGNEATFHQHSQTGTALRNFRESLRQGSNLTRIVGLGVDATMPFINTPINIAKTGIEYTPGLGMIKTISDVNNASMDMKADVLVDSISKQFAGGMLAAVGYFLAKAGILNGKGGDDKKDKLEKNLGKLDYSINIGDNTYDLSWLSPSAMPLFVGVELEKTLRGNNEISPQVVMDVLAKTVDPLSEMSVISSVTEALQSYSKGTQALKDIGTSAFTSYISQYFPTLMGQVATLFDDKQRSSTGKTVTEKLINQIKYKMPGLRNTLPEQINVWGEDKKLADNPVQKAFEAFLSPSNRKELKVDDTTKEIERIYDKTGQGLPSLSLTQSPKIDSDYVNLSSEEYTKYKKDYGKTSKELLDELVNLKDYKDATDEERRKMISAIYDYSTYVARKNIADDKDLKYEYKQSDGTGYNYPKYYLSLSKDDFAEYIAKKYNEEDD